MSLRMKGLLLFLLLGLAPILAWTWYHFVQTRDAVRAGAQSELETRAAWIETHMEREVAALRDELRRLARTRTADGPGWARPADVDLPGAVLSLRIGEDEPIAPDGESRARAPADPRWAAGADPETGLCVTGGTGPLVRIDLPMPGAESLDGAPAMTARVDPAALLPSGFGDRTSVSSGRTVILDRASGVVVSTPPCGPESTLAKLIEVMERPDTAGPQAAAGPSGSALPVLDGGAFASLFDVSGSEWRVLTAADAVPASLTFLQITHLFLLLMLGIGSALVFSLVVGRWLRSLDELREAARRIGQGDLAPWLPPPGDDEVGWLSVALGRMADRVTHMMRRIDQTSRLEVAGVMASHLAHELRTPLSSIRLNLQGLARELEAERLPSEWEPNVRIGLREVSRLERTVDTVLQVAGGRAGPEPEPTLCSVHDTVREASRLLADVFRESGVEIVHDLRAEADAVRVDEGRLRGVFMNLMVNASEAITGSGTITVASSLTLDHDGRHVVAVSVSDTGSGVPPDLRDEIFSPFFTTKSEGSGIGLPVALRSVRDEGGDLFLADESEPGCGARFVVSLPTVEERIRRPSIYGPGGEESGDAVGVRWMKDTGPKRVIALSTPVGASECEWWSGGSGNGSGPPGARESGE